MKSVQLQEGGKALIKNTRQVVEVKRVSQHGIAIVAFRTGGEYVMPHNRLVPVTETVLACA